MHKKIILDEIERANNSPPHESWFIPFGKESEEVDYLIHRFKKGNEWYIEPEMIRGKKLIPSSGLIDSIKDYFSEAQTSQAYTNYKAMVEDVFKFQKFAHCETDTITLSFPEKVYAQKNINDRIDQIIAVIDSIMEKGRVESPTKRFELDENGRDVLFRCKDKTRREELEKKLHLVEVLAARDRENILKNQKPEIVDDARIASLADEIKTAVEETTKTMELAKIKGMYKDFAESKTAQGKNISVEELDKALGKFTSAIPDKAKEEKQIIEKLFNELNAVQEALDEYIKKVDKVRENDSNHPGLNKLVEELKALDNRQKEIAGMLQTRCQDWSRVKDVATKADLASKRINGEKSELRELVESLRKVEEKKDITEQEKAIEMKRIGNLIDDKKNAIEASTQEMGELDSYRIDPFQENLGRYIKGFHDQLDQNKNLSNDLSSRVQTISNEIERAKAEKELAHQRFSR